MIRMSSTRKRSTKHEGMTVYFVSEYAKCPVCAKDSIIDNYDLCICFLHGFITWGLDRSRIFDYHGPNREERNRIIEKVKEDLERNNGDLKRRIEIVEGYAEVRERFTW
jgi:hypothetical protein